MSDTPETAHFCTSNDLCDACLEKMAAGLSLLIGVPLVSPAVIGRYVEENPDAVRRAIEARAWLDEMEEEEEETQPGQ